MYASLFPLGMIYCNRNTDALYPVSTCSIFEHVQVKEQIVTHHYTWTPQPKPIIPALSIHNFHNLCGDLYQIFVIIVMIRQCEEDP